MLVSSNDAALERQILVTFEKGGRQGPAPFFLTWGESSLKTVRISKTMAVKMRAVSARLLFLILLLLTVTGCATTRSASDLTAESAGQAVRSQSTPPETGRSPDGPQSSVKMIIYTDFQCGACERFHSQVEPELRARYVVNGKAQSETRLVGALGAESLRAGEAALCAADQGLFPEYQAALFAAWREIDGDAYSDEQLIDLAGTLGLDTKALRRCLDIGSKRPELEKNLKMAEAEGVHTLPAVFIGGVKIEGYRPLGVYTRVMERILRSRLSQ